MVELVCQKEMFQRVGVSKGAAAGRENGSDVSGDGDWLLLLEYVLQDLSIDIGSRWI
jgi:hypothetical protein